MASGGRGRERERVREWARVGEEDVVTFKSIRSARDGDRRTSVSEWLKQGRRGPSAAPSGLSARLDVTSLIGRKCTAARGKEDAKSKFTRKVVPGRCAAKPDYITFIIGVAIRAGVC